MSRRTTVRAGLRPLAHRLGLVYDRRRSAIFGRIGDLRLSAVVHFGRFAERIDVAIRMPDLGLGLWIRPERGLARLLKRVWAAEVQLGDPVIDPALLIHCQYPDWARRHLNTVELREALRTLLNCGARVHVSDRLVRIRVSVREGTELEEVVVESCAVALALQDRGATALQALDLPGLHVSAAVAAGTVAGTPISIREVARPSGSMLEICAVLPWTTSGLYVSHVDEGASSLGDLVLDLLVSVVADDMDAVREMLCRDAVRGPLGAICHGRPGSVWAGEQLRTYAENDVADVAAAVDDVLDLAAALRGPSEHEDDARAGAGDLGDAMLEGALGRASEDDQIAPSDPESLAGGAADRSDQERARLADGDQGDE